MSMDTVPFVWAVSPPDPVNGERVKEGDEQQLPPGQAQRYESVNYGKVGKPEKHVEKAVTVRMLVNYSSQLWALDGARTSLKRGDVIRMEEVQGLRLVASGQATRDLKSDVDDLPTSYLEDTPDAVAAQKHLERLRPPKVETQAEVEHREQQLELRRRRNARMTGWFK